MKQSHFHSLKLNILSRAMSWFLRCFMQTCMVSFPSRLDCMKLGHIMWYVNRVLDRNLALTTLSQYCTFSTFYTRQSTVIWSQNRLPTLYSNDYTEQEKQCPQSIPWTNPTLKDHTGPGYKNDPYCLSLIYPNISHHHFKMVLLRRFCLRAFSIRVPDTNAMKALALWSF